MGGQIQGVGHIAVESVVGVVAVEGVVGVVAEGAVQVAVVFEVVSVF